MTGQGPHLEVRDGGRDGRGEPALARTHLEHDLHATEEAEEDAHDGEKGVPRVHLPHYGPHPIQADAEADKVCHRHELNVEGAAGGAGVPVPPSALVEGGRDRPLGQQFRQQEHTYEPAPREQGEGNIVPDGDKGEDDPDVVLHVAGPAQWDVEVADEPAIEGPVPGAPKTEAAVDVG